jgi:hypothetical protein
MDVWTTNVLNRCAVPQKQRDQMVEAIAWIKQSIQLQG